MRQALRIEKSRPLSGGPKDLHYGQTLLLKATIMFRSMRSPKEALKIYKKAINVIGGINPGTTKVNKDFLIQNILTEVKSCLAAIGMDEADVEDLSEEEDHEDEEAQRLKELGEIDIMKDFQSQLIAFKATNPI